MALKVALANIFLYLDTVEGVHWGSTGADGTETWTFPNATQALGEVMDCYERTTHLTCDGRFQSLGHGGCQASDDHEVVDDACIRKDVYVLSTTDRQSILDGATDGNAPAINNFAFALGIEARRDADPLGGGVPLWIPGFATPGDSDRVKSHAIASNQNTACQTAGLPSAIVQRSCARYDGKPWTTGGDPDFWLALISERVSAIKKSGKWPLDAAAIMTVILPLLLTSSGAN